ncbi:MAG: ferredoxin, partial [Planctomycetaceae bacterium]|nr:ferredoxin [Planctomycetaceae bacterium]
MLEQRAGPATPNRWESLMDLEIRVDRGTCIGSGQCVHWAPGVFDQDEGAIS